MPLPRDPPFDQIVVVDWSASAKPTRGRDSIWVGRCEVGSERRETRNLPTRAAAASYLAELLGRSAATGAATLVGLDFSFGYPAGFAEVVDPRPRRGPGESVGPGA
ncbi:MAG TPA: hypothetical protein VGL60_12550, partial [Acidimicrobiales bacterium]